MPSALLIDFDGVLRQWPDSPDWPVQFQITEAEIRDVAFTSTLLQSVILGEISDDAWRAAVVTGLARFHRESESQRAVDLWSRNAGVLVPEVVELLGKVPASIRVVLATNATSRLPLDIESLGLAQLFDAVANSSRLGVAKPDPAFFLAALQLAGVAPADALFVDDTPENVSSASRLGIRSHHFRGPGPMVAFLEHHNALV